MPEFDIVVLVPIKMRISAKDVRHARDYGPQVVKATVDKQLTTVGLCTLKSLVVAEDNLPDDLTSGIPSVY